MDVTPLQPAGRQLIEGYGDGGFRVSRIRYEGSVLVLRDETLAWPVTSMKEVTLERLAPLFPAEDKGVEVLLLGCGPSLLPVPADLRQQLRERGVIVEPMDTGAACRTYHVLLAEERRVAAALIAVG